MTSTRTLITGGAGLIGSTIADRLSVDPENELIVYDNLERGRMANLTAALERGNLTFVEGDIRDRELLGEVMDGVDVVYHQAAIRITQCAEDPRLALEVMADGTFNVLEAAVAANVGKVIAASSASVYGLADAFPTTEEQHPHHNRTIYGATKTFNEGLLRAFYDMYGLDYVALRYFNVYGPRMDIHGVYTEVLIRWMEKIENGEAPVIFGDGTQTMDFVYADDIARANILAAESSATDVVANVASGIETSLNELAAATVTAMGADLEAVHVEERKVNPVGRRLADTSRARDLFGFEAEISLDEGLRRLVDWWRAENTAENTKVEAAS
jgi:UDP-glucose 4-epimerase